MPLCGAMLRTWALAHVAYTSSLDFSGSSTSSHVTAACPAAAASVRGTPQGSPRSVHYTCIDNLAMLRDLETDRPRRLRQQAPPPP
ncbi:hypothetical protein BD626DRAFT_471750 [Schizophyllum amplum]|uniref:Secreted protein n=1 Tax=Schizophyllum amplum TaxID=97359 RepID=A0A550CVG4_9AGAR|nr:hypothetical protein BD626DRAFT_471750 [Auriculariopsis ampla]